MEYILGTFGGLRPDEQAGPGIFNVPDLIGEAYERMGGAAAN